MANRKKKRNGKTKKTKTSTNKRLRPVSRDLPELGQARSLWAKNHFSQAIKLFEETVRKNPSNPIALTDAARALGDRFEFLRAERMLARLVEIAGQRAELLQLAGQSYRMIQRPQQAIDCLERALAASPDLEESRLELAMLYERRHRLDDALRHVTECLRSNPNSLEAQFLRGRVLRRLGELTPAESQLRKVAAAPDGHAIVCSQAWHELGQLYDEAGQYDDAFQAVVKGKKAQMTEVGDLKKRSQKESKALENLLSQLSADHFRQWRDQASGWQQEKVALLTGPPRSGTTLLEKVLDSHPDLVSSDEQVAFSKYIMPDLLIDEEQEQLGESSLGGVSEETLLQQRQRYLSYLANSLGEPIGNRLLIDKNPSIVMLIPGMLRLFPECKLLIAVRDPRDVMVSCFMRYLPLNAVSVDFCTLEGVARRNIRDMNAWLRLRDMVGSPWLEVRYEDTVQDMKREAQRALEFLSVSWDDAVLSYRDQLSHQHVNSPTYEAVVKPIYRSAIGRWQNYEKHLEPVLEQMAPLVKKFGYET